MKSRKRSRQREQEREGKEDARSQEQSKGSNPGERGAGRACHCWLLSELVGGGSEVGDCGLPCRRLQQPVQGRCKWMFE